MSNISLHPPKLNSRRKLIIKIQNSIYKHVEKKKIPDSVSSIIILAQEKLGDAILLLPFLNGFNKRFPDAIIDLCCTHYNKKVFEGIPFIRNCISYRPFNFRFSKIIRSERYQILYNPKSGPSKTFHHLTNKINAEVKVCLDHKYNNPIYNYSLPNDNSKHIVEKYSELLHYYDDSSIVSNWLPEFFLKFPSNINNRKYIAINISAGNQSRKIPAEKWIKAIASILEINNTNIALFASRKESRDAIKIKSVFKEKIFYPLESPTLYHASGIINDSEMLLSVDTSLIHLAAALGKPVLGLYNNDKLNYTRYSPYNTISENVVSKTGFIRDIDVESIIHSYKLLDLRIRNR
jgi:ADP-heptose:LPS heptosyltransferase